MDHTVDALLIIFGYVVVGGLFYYALEPWLRLRKDIKLAKDKMDQEMIRTMGSIFWPLAIIFYPLLRFIVFPVCRYLSHLSDLADKYWETQPVKPVVEPIIDAAKSGYRNIEMK